MITPRGFHIDFYAYLLCFFFLMSNGVRYETRTGDNGQRDDSLMLQFYS